MASIAKTEASPIEQTLAHHHACAPLQTAIALTCNPLYGVSRSTRLFRDFTRNLRLRLSVSQAKTRRTWLWQLCHLHLYTPIRRGVSIDLQKNYVLIVIICGVWKKIFCRMLTAGAVTRGAARCSDATAAPFLRSKYKALLNILCLVRANVNSTRGRRQWRPAGQGKLV